MKFHSKDDCEQFLLEIGEYQLLGSAAKDFPVSGGMMESFLSRRSSVVGKLKDFRKSQNQKQNWRKNRYKIMKGIKTFHKSTEGKKFHRQLTRFITTRNFRESYKSIYDLAEILAALSSARTHHLIEVDYYRPLDEEVDYQLFGEEFISCVYSIERAIIDDKDFDQEDIDFLSRCIDRKSLTQEVSSLFSVNVNEAILFIDSSLEEDSVLGDNYIDRINNIVSHFNVGSSLS